MSELAKCPFCKGKANYHETYAGDHRITCALCGVKVYGDSEEDVAAKWNRRAAPECPKVEWRMERSNIDAYRAYINNMGVVLAIKGKSKWIGMGYFCDVDWMCDGTFEEVQLSSEKYIKDTWNKLHSGARS